MDYLLLFITILTIYVSWFYYKYFTRVNPLPGPFPLPFFGNVLQLFWLGEDTKVFFEYCYKNYGDMFEVYLNGRNIVLNRTEHIEKLMTTSTKHTHLVKRTPEIQGLVELGITKGILMNNDYNSWRYNRQFFSLAMLSPKFTYEAIDCTNGTFNELEGYWNKLYLNEDAIKENKNILDLPVWLNLCTNDLIIKLLTGEKSYSMTRYFDTLNDKESSTIVESSVKLVQALRKHSLGIQIFVFVPPFIRHYVPFFKGQADDILKNKDYINERLDEIIKKRRQEIENTSLDEHLMNDMLTSMITANTLRDVNFIKNVGGEDTDRPMNDVEIRGNLIDGFLGGSDTTANSVSFIFYYLAHNPDVKKKLLNEIDTTFKGDKTRPITEDDFNKLKYCEAVIKEAARIFPVITSIIRTIDKPDEIAGYQWQTDTMFRVSIDIIQNKKDYWEDPDKFDPDRWIVDGNEPKKNSFLMFGGGLRICPGRKLAMIESTCLIVSLLRRYDFDLVDKKAPLKTFTNSVTICRELLIKIKPRN